MIRDYSDNADVLESLESFAFAIARGIEDKSAVGWDNLAGICDQRYYSLRVGNPVPLDIQLLSSIEAKILKYLEADQEDKVRVETVGNPAKQAEDDIKSLIKHIEEVLSDGELSPDVIGSYIVGYTIIQDNYDDYQKKYPALAAIAELAADLETIKDESFATKIVGEIKDRFAVLKENPSYDPNAAIARRQTTPNAWILDYLRYDISSDLRFLEKLYEKVILSQYAGIEFGQVKWIDHGKVGPDAFAHYFKDYREGEYVLVFEDYPGTVPFDDGLSHEVLLINGQRSLRFSFEVPFKYIENVSGYFTLFKEKRR